MERCISRENDLTLPIEEWAKNDREWIYERKGEQRDTIGFTKKPSLS